ncbi:MAG: AraC family transcriptional regulator, partial [Muribaculaceae bacterium]
LNKMYNFALYKYLYHELMVQISDKFQGSRAIIIPPSIITEMEQNPFESQLHITDIGYYPNANFHHRLRNKAITQYVLIYCTSGKGWFKINHSKINHIEENQFFILPANVPHEYGADKIHPWSIYWVHFKGVVADFFAQDFDKPTTIPFSEKSRIIDRIEIFEEIYKTLELGYSSDNLDYAISTLYYFLGSIKYIGQFRESSKTSENSKNIIDVSIRYMRENIENKTTLNDICDYLGYSESHFSNIFKRSTGYAPIQYMLQLKIQVACHLLDFSNLKVNQICYKIGIGDPYYFSRLFTKIIGKSPTEYRNTKKG